MKRKADLFYLIKAMSKSEKRYFTLDAQKSGRKDSRYLELFQAINDMENYDENLLKDQFGKTLPTDKAYLYEAILRSMRDYRSANSYAARIKEMIMDAKYLYERGLYEQSEERLLNAKKLTLELGDQLSAIELNKEHRRILKDTKRLGYENELKHLIQEKQDNVQMLEEELTYLDIHDQLLMEIRNNRQGLDEHQKENLRIRFSQLADNQIEEPKSIASKLRFYQCMVWFHQLLNDQDHVYNYYMKIVNCWDTSPKYKAEEFYRYILDVSNLIHILLADASKTSQINQLLARLEEERPASVHDQNILFQRITSFRLLYAINTGDVTDVHLIVKRIDKGLKQYDISDATRTSIIFNVALLLFMAGHFQLCREWIDKIIHQRNLQIRQDIQNAGRLLHLLATVELNVFEETEASIRNTFRFFQKSDYKESNFMLKLLNYLKKMHSGTPQQSKQAQKQLTDYITTLPESSDKAPLGFDELILHWLESKSTKRSISSIIKTKFAKAAS